MPQLFNVLKGEMSLVGPRPLSSKEMIGDDNWREIRLSVKPGMTGLWQIRGRRSNKFGDWIKNDIEYVQKRSFLMDIKILLLTTIAVLRKQKKISNSSRGTCNNGKDNPCFPLFYRGLL